MRRYSEMEIEELQSHLYLVWHDMSDAIRTCQQTGQHKYPDLREYEVEEKNIKKALDRKLLQRKEKTHEI